MMKRRIIAILVALCAIASVSAQTDEPASAEFLRGYGFVLNEPNLTCAKGGQSGMVKDSRPGVTWYTLCELGLNTPNYVGVMTKRRYDNALAVQKDFGDAFMAVTKDSGTRPLRCVFDPTKDVVTGMGGEMVDCVLAPGGGQKPMHSSFFYFSPEGDKWGKVIVFSDFGLGDKSHEGFKAAARERIAKNLKQVATK